jgi:L-iditol 2-dehydrogenase
VPLDEVCYRELVVTGANASTPESWRRALALVDAREVELDALVSDALPLREWERAFAAARAGKAVKILLVPR